MTNNPLFDREALQQLLAEARAQRSHELRGASRDFLRAVHWRGVALAGVACFTIVGVAACAG